MCWNLITKCSSLASQSKETFETLYCNFQPLVQKVSFYLAAGEHDLGAAARRECWHIVRIQHERRVAVADGLL